MDAKKIATFLREHYQFIGVLVGVIIVWASMGTYTNWDAETEFYAASSVVTKGFPYVSTGYMIDQAPFAFYLTAPTLLLFGLSYVNGVGLVTALGLGCVVLIYALGTLLYGKRSGLVAAALFGIVPWQVFMSRTYLIDVPYLFLSLGFLLAGILAVKRNSEKLVVACGVLFALAFLTKLFAIFMMVPLLLVVWFKRKESGFRLTVRRAVLFLIPTLIMQAVWFGGFANQHFFGVYVPSDFTHSVHIADPSIAYLPRIFIESAGWFLLAAAAFALVLAVSFRRLLARNLWVDVVCAVSVAAIGGLDLVLVLGLHMLVPYVSAFKYTYAVLPFICLLAASLADKGMLLADSVDKRKVKLLLISAGLVLVLASLVESVAFLNHTEPYTLVDFKVDYNGNYFPFNVYTPVSGNFQMWHYAALTVIVLSLVFPWITGASVAGVKKMKRGFALLLTILST